LLNDRERDAAENDHDRSDIDEIANRLESSGFGVLIGSAGAPQFGWK